MASKADDNCVVHGWFLHIRRKPDRFGRSIAKRFVVRGMRRPVATLQHPPNRRMYQTARVLILPRDYRGQGKARSTLHSTGWRSLVGSKVWIRC
jgi:hypothetical protein